jgi:hypothetical protein
MAARRNVITAGMLGNNTLLFAAALSLATIVVGCGDNTHPAKTHAPSKTVSSATPYSSNYLNSVLTNGMAKQMILVKFGPPMDGKEVAPGIICLDYFSGATPEEITNDDSLVGFQILLQSNSLIRWSPVLTSTTRAPMQQKNAVPAAANARISSSNEGIGFYVVTEQSINGGKYIDTARFPQLGYIHSVPDMEIRKIKSVDKQSLGAGTGKNQLLISLRSEDAKALSQFSRTNIGNRILITVGGVPIMAPRIESPIDTPSFLITAISPQEADAVFLALKQK